MFGNTIANMVTVPGDSPIFDRPENHGLAYEDVSFEASDGVTLRGWLVRGGSERVIVQSHFASQCSRAGYTPEGKGMVKLWAEDISFLRQARALVDAGYSVLMYDFRNHGESDAGSMTSVTGGSEESKDVIAAVDFISRHPDFTDASIGLLSICMGTNATSFAFGVDGGLHTYDALKAYVSIQPLVYGHFLRGMGIPQFLVDSGNQANLERGGVDFYRTPLENLKSVHVPTLMVQNRNDPWTNLAWVEKYFEAIPTEKEMLWLDLSKKRAAAYDWVGTRPDDVLRWFGKHL